MRTEVELEAAVRDLGVPLILKTASSGYDGKGQVLVDRAADADAGMVEPGPGRLRGRGLGRVRRRGLRRRGPRAATAAPWPIPVGLNHHERHILDTTVMPAPVGPIVALEARTLALAVAQALGTVGVLTVEFFLTAEGRLMVNEIAPRPHNSGHLTIEAAYSSQFEQQVRAALRPAPGIERPGHARRDGQPAGRPLGRRRTSLGRGARASTRA